ncbi:MAG: hypothetical protein M3Y59_09735 [Myxococcota bacterium]|nr:hypothetical protein [Myxococcota bacterium]
MKRSNLLIAVALFGSTVGSLAAAQVTPGGKENYRRAPVVQVPERRDDRWDLRRLESVQQRLDRASRGHRRQELRAVDSDLRAYLAAELREQRAEVMDAQADVRGGKASRADGRELRTERRDLKRLREIDSDLKKVYGRVDRHSYTQRQKLVQQLVDLARQELRADRNPIHRSYAWR